MAKDRDICQWCDEPISKTVSFTNNEHNYSIIMDRANNSYNFDKINCMIEWLKKISNKVI